MSNTRRPKPSTMTKRERIEFEITTALSDVAILRFWDDPMEEKYSPTGSQLFYRSLQFSPFKLLEESLKE